ncbi:MAG: tryptophan--tRNA ligase [Brevinematales bacterium]|nr:tryptophan--tRNA ligase [Brevinematales bacterium]
MRILSGIQPTGYLHYGNYFGAVRNWVRLQNDPKNETFYFIADLHALTSNQAGYKTEVQVYIENLVVDLLASGIDPDRSVLFLQSDVPEHSELFVILSMLSPVSWLERNPTYKEKMEEIKGKDLDNLGFLGYPVLQTADIALYEATHVPVGKDQVPHLEISREIIRRFNTTYNTDVLVEPQPLFSEVPKLNGLDGRKMSKSYNNAIYLADDPDTIRKKIMSMITDVKRPKKTDPGHPDECLLFPFYAVFCQDQNRIEDVRKRCMAAELGCVEDKKQMAEIIIDYFADFHRKRQEILSKKGMVNEILAEGAKKARAVAKATMEKVRAAMGMATHRRYE